MRCLVLAGLAGTLLGVSAGCLGPSVFVDKAGDGEGMVTSDPEGIECGDACGAILSGLITLAATPDASSEFVGWAGACTGSEPCVLEAGGTDNRLVTARFARKSYELVVTASEGGAIATEPEGIECGAQCSATFVHGTRLRFVARAAAGYSFVRWTFLECALSTASSCVLDLVEPRTIGAEFALDQGLTVTRTGSGYGTVSSNPAGITCNGPQSACHATFPSTTQVTLTAQPDPMATFAGWSGDCAGAATTCTVTMETARAVTATFVARPTHTLSLVVSGSGTVSSSPAGISCPGQCAYPFLVGEVVELTATPVAGSSFVGWTGDCMANGLTCFATANAAKTVTASFSSGGTSCTQTVTTSESAMTFNQRLTVPGKICLAPGVTITGTVQVGANYVTIQGASSPKARIVGSGSDVIRGNGMIGVILQNLDIEATGTGPTIVVNANGGRLELNDSIARCNSAMCAAVVAQSAAAVTVARSTLLVGAVGQLSGVGLAASGGSIVTLQSSTVDTYGPALTAVSGASVSATGCALTARATVGTAINVADAYSEMWLGTTKVRIAGTSVLSTGSSGAVSVTIESSELRKMAGGTAGSYSPLVSNHAGNGFYSFAANSFCNEGTSTTDGQLAPPLISGAYAASSNFYSVAHTGPANCTN